MITTINLRSFPQSKLTPQVNMSRFLEEEKMEHFCGSVTLQKMLHNILYNN